MFTPCCPSAGPTGGAGVAFPAGIWVKRFNQQYSSYSHEYPVDSVTVSYYDDAENHQLLLTVYSDGVCIVNSAFVNVKYSGGGAAELYQALAEIVE